MISQREGHARGGSNRKHADGTVLISGAKEAEFTQKGGGYRLTRQRLIGGYDRWVCMGKFSGWKRGCEVSLTCQARHGILMHARETSMLVGNRNELEREWVG